MMVRWADVRREPYRLLFPLGILYGLLGANHWLAYALGWATTYSGFYHASMQVNGYMTCFIVGFLLTALPRFSATPPANRLECSVVVALLLSQPALLSLGRWAAAEACVVALLAALAVFAARRFLARRAEVGAPTEFVWILIAVLNGLIGQTLLILGQTNVVSARVLAAARPMAQQGFLLSVVLGVGGFMAPRLMGRTTLPVTPLGMTPAQGRRVRLQRIAWHLLAGLLLFGSFWIEAAGAMRLAYAMRALIVTAELAWTTSFYRRPVIRDGYVRLVWLSLWSIVIGLWAAALSIRLCISMLHLVFLGGLSLMTFAVSTMVVLSHAGVGERLRQRLWVLDVAAAGLGLSLAARLLADRMSAYFFPLLGVAALGWSVAGVGWLVFALPHVLRQVPAETFERAHAEAKQRLLR